MDAKKALAEFSSYFEKRGQALAAIEEHDATRFLTQACALIDRFAPPGSAYCAAKDKAISRTVVGGARVRRSATHLGNVDAILKALQDDYANDRIELPPDLSNGAFTRIEQVLIRFHKVVRKLSHRHGGRTPLTIGDEYDVQDLLKAIFAIDFEDVRAEEWAPSYPGSSKRMDFVFKKHGISTVSGLSTLQGIVS
jgi:REase_DpnII-MboI